MKSISCTLLLSILNSGIFFSLVNTVPISSTFADFNKNCNSTIPCDSTALLTCTGGTCQCESPSNQRYDPKLNICLSNIGGHCSLDAKKQAQQGSSPRKCVQNAECIQINGSDGNLTECQCKPGFIENSSGGCVPGIGQPCNYGPEECNSLGMVVCKNGKCSCFDSLQIYDNETKRCVSPVGTICKYDNLQLGCVKNAICYPFYYWVLPRCLCKPGFYVTVDRNCAPYENGHNGQDSEL